MKKRILSLVMALVLAVGLLPVGAMAADTVTVTVTMDTQSVAENVATYDLTALPASTQVTVPADSTIAAVMTQWAQDQDVTVTVADGSYITSIGDFGDYTSTQFERLCKNAGLDTKPIDFQYAGWTYLLNGQYGNGIAIDKVSQGDTISFRYGVYMTSGTWVQADHKFLDAYNAVAALINQANAADEQNYSTTQWTALQASKASAEELKTEIDTESNGMWFSYFADKTTTLWGPDSPTDKLQKAQQALENALNKLVSPTSITFAENEITLSLGNTYTIQPTVGPDGTSQEVTYEAFLGDDYFSVSDMGIVTPTGTSSLCWVKVTSKIDSTVFGYFKFKIIAPADAEKVTMAKDQLTWDNIKGLNESESSVTSSLVLPTEIVLPDGLGTVDVSWVSSNPAAVTDNGSVTRPTAGQPSSAATLTATLTSGNETGTVTINITVLAEHTPNTTDGLKPLLQNIAASYVNNTGEWVVMDMGAYTSLGLDSTATSKSAKQEYLNKSITSITAGSSSDTTYSKAILALTASGVDVTQLYTVNSNTSFNAIEGLNGVTHSSSAWSAPYTLAAYNQGNFTGTETAEETLINVVLANQKENGSWDEFGTTDTTGNMIAGLAFYAGEPNVDNAIEKAINYLSSVQKEDGTFDDGQTGAWASGKNANSTAMVIVGLTANGVNPDTDSRFIKNGNSALDGLLSFALADKRGFGWKNNESLNPGATEQGFRALIAAYQVMSTGRAYNVYDFSANEVVPGRATGTGSVAPPTTPPETNKDITVTVTVKADTGYWLQNKSVTVDEGSTAYHAFVKALDGSGITQVGAENGYVESMTKNGTTLAEFTKGEASGWLYKVNETLPDVGLTDYTISDGDSIVWYYTEDWTKDPQASSGSSPLPETAMDKVEALIDKIGTVTADSGQAIQAAREAYDKLTDAQKKLVENYDVLKKAEAAYAALTSALPFTDIADHWALEAIQYVYEKDLMNGVSDAVFAPNKALNRAMLATILYRMEGSPIVTAANPYSDVAADTWYTDAVIWASENGIVNGYGSGKFGPTDNITREQLAAMLLRYSDYKEYDTDARNHLTSYTDAGAISAWALESVQWANAEGLVTGRTETTIVPKGSTTRAETATILMRYLEKAAG